MSGWTAGTYSTLELGLDPPVARVALNRPQVRNAFNPTMIAELTEAFAGLAGREDISVIVLEGRGKAFSAGADIEWMRESIDYSQETNMADAGRMATMFETIDRTPQPVVARVHGAALGGGMGLIAACDVVVAADDALFGFTEPRLGIVPAVISGLIIPAIGPSWARALFVSGKRFGADLAQQIGLVHRVVAAAGLQEALDSEVSEILKCGPRAVREAKRLVLDAATLDRASFREHTARVIAEVRTSDEGQEGLRAFIEKRPPRWTGRP